MRKVAILPSFERSLENLSPPQRKQLSKSLEDFYDFATTGLLPQGLVFKKLSQDIYEFRVNIHLRVVVRDEGEIFYLIFVGSHDDIRRYLRR